MNIIRQSRWPLLNRLLSRLLLNKLFLSRSLLNGLMLSRLMNSLLLLIIIGYVPLNLAQQPTSTAKEKVKQDTNDQPISLHFQETPITLVLKALADCRQINLVMDESISGQLTLSLENVPWQQAMQVILRLKQLTMKIENNIMLVFPDEQKNSASQLVPTGQVSTESAMEKSNLEGKKQLEAGHGAQAVQPLQTRHFVLQHADADNLANLLQQQLSSQGKLIIDQANRGVIIKDTPAEIADFADTLRLLDQPQKQIQIAAHIVNISTESLREMGVEWGLKSNEATATSSRINTLNLHFPAKESGLQIGFQLGKLKGKLLDLTLSALEQESRAEIIASPRLSTADRHKASIKQGSEIPYEVASGNNGTTTIEFKEAVLGMEVTPQVMGNGEIELLLLISQNTPGRLIKRGEKESLAIDKQEIQTRVRVADGETLALGGIFQQTNQQQLDKVPGLGDIPLLGHLFQRKSKNQGRRELVIFITPSLINAAPAKTRPQNNLKNSK